jgi:hypothetical protein
VQVQVSDKDERVICYIVNTAEYCHETVRYGFLRAAYILHTWPFSVLIRSADLN